MRVRKGMLNQYVMGTRRPTRKIDRLPSTETLTDDERAANEENGNYYSLSDFEHVRVSVRNSGRGYLPLSEALSAVNVR